MKDDEYEEVISQLYGKTDDEGDSLDSSSDNPDDNDWDGNSYPVLGDDYCPEANPR